MESNDTTGGGRVPFGDITNNLGNFLVISCDLVYISRGIFLTMYLQIFLHREIHLLNRLVMYILQMMIWIVIRTAIGCTLIHHTSGGAVEYHIQQTSKQVDATIDYKKRLLICS